MVKPRRRPARRPYGKVVIVGLGLMGGSLALALKHRGLAKQVVGVARRRQTLERAKALGAVDSGTLSGPQAVRDAELVVMAVPLGRTVELLQALTPHLPAGALVTDVGSAKVKLLRDLEKLWYQPDLIGKTVPPAPGFAFASSHPMAGSEKDGLDAARRDLYDGAHTFLVRNQRTPAAALERLRAFWLAVGCGRVSVIGPEAHDRWVALVSHLPHGLAACLVNQLAEAAAKDARICEAAGPGFRDTTRIAKGSPVLWEEILMYNRDEVCAAIDRFRHHLTRLETALKSGETKRLFEQLEQASRFRREWEQQLGCRKVR